MSALQLDKNELFLRYVEEELMIGGGRWIATFNIAIRNFHISKALHSKTSVAQSSKIDSLIYGGVRHSGFILSRAFSFMASPTYRVGCAAVTLENPKKAKWSHIVNWMRDLHTIKKEMEFEWLWLLISGNGPIDLSLIKKIQSHVTKELGLVYVDLKNDEIHHSDGFIARHGAKLFHPKNLKKKPSKLKFWAR
ncbi:MAG: hypothetical protein ACW97Z_08410 [Candidatus Hodarchaeales archaeon]